MKSRWLRFFVILLALAVVAAACGNDDDDGVTAGEGSEESAATEEPMDDTEEPAEEPAEEPVDEEPVTIDESVEVEAELVPTGNTGYTSGAILTTDCSDGRPTGGSLTMGMFGEITGWDPSLIQGGASLGGTQMTALYDALFYLDLTTGAVVPGLAESITTDNNEVFTLTLRDGITFTDGTVLDAEAFIWNVQHHQDPAVGSQSSAQANLIADVVAIDDLTLEITATSANATFPQIFTNRMAWMMSPTAYQDGQDAETRLNTGINVNPQGVGAGPFVFDSWTQDDEAVLVRNPDYFREGCPYLDEVVFKPIIDPAQRYNAFNAGDLDIAFDRNPQNINDAIDTGVNTTTRIDNHGGYWMLNNQKEPFNIRACRAAAAYAIDYDTLNEIAWDGLRVVDRTVMKPGSPWLDPDVTLPGFDLAASTEALQECELELGQPLEFETFCTTSPENVLITETLVAMWDAAAISVTANCVEVGEMVTAVFSGESVANPWAIPVADPDYMYDVYFGDSSENGVCGEGLSSRNWSKSCFPGFDEGLTQGRQGLTFEERYEGYQLFQQTFVEEVPVIILDKPETGYYWTDDVSGVFMSETGLALVGYIAKS